MPINKFKYRERQILCIRLKWNKVLYAWEWPLCHDLLRFSLCSDDLLPSLKIDWVRGFSVLAPPGSGVCYSPLIFGSGVFFRVRGRFTVLANFSVPPPSALTFWVRGSFFGSGVLTINEIRNESPVLSAIVLSPFSFLLFIVLHSSPFLFFSSFLLHRFSWSSLHLSSFLSPPPQFFGSGVLWVRGSLTNLEKISTRKSQKN